MKFLHNKQRISDFFSTLGKFRNNNNLSQLESHENNLPSKLAQIVFLAFANFFNHVVHPQTF